MTELINHLWQSSLFAALAALVAHGLRKQPAKMRHAVWMLASVKFLVPFSLLISLGSRVDLPYAAPGMPALAVEQLSVSFSPAPVTGIAGATSWPEIAEVVWMAGALCVMGRWGRRWLCIRRELKTATRLPIEAPIPVLSIGAMIEPGVFGLFRPVLLLPPGIATRLASEQLDAVLTHELAHVHRRDNLTAAFHMAVEALFWFHPLVWWIGATLVEERERACDEAVLAAGRSPQVYAQSILTICRFYVESPLVCAAGVSGADLRQRIEGILTRPRPARLTWALASMLVMVAAAVVATPLAIGILRAQTLPPPPQYRFEVASIRPGRPGALSGGMSPGPQGGFRAENMTVLELINYAYSLRDDQLTGAPKWAGTDRFSITATPDRVEALGPGLSPAEFEGHHNRQRQRMQSLLRDRFGLVLRAGTREMQIYGLRVDRNGVKFAASPDQKGAPTIRLQRGRMTGKAVGPALLGKALSQIVGRAVDDETGLAGFYDFDLTWTPDPPPDQPVPAETGGPSIFTAVQEQLGLRLVPKKGAVPVLVIEKLEKPSEN